MTAMQKLHGYGNELLINSCANFGLTNSERTVAHAANIKSPLHTPGKNKTDFYRKKRL